MMTFFYILDPVQHWFVGSSGKFTAGVEAKMVAATAVTAAMTVTGRKRMALTVTKTAATAAMDCRGGRDGSNGRKKW